MQQMIEALRDVTCALALPTQRSIQLHTLGNGDEQMTVVGNEMPLRHPILPQSKQFSEISSYMHTKLPIQGLLTILELPTTWCLQSHTEWHRLSHTFTGSLRQLEIEIFKRRRLSIIPGSLKPWESSDSDRGGFPIAVTPVNINKETSTCTPSAPKPCSSLLPCSSSVPTTRTASRT